MFKCSDKAFHTSSFCVFMKKKIYTHFHRQEWKFHARDHKMKGWKIWNDLKQTLSQKNTAKEPLWIYRYFVAFRTRRERVKYWSLESGNYVSAAKSFFTVWRMTRNLTLNIFTGKGCGKIFGIIFHTYPPTNKV